MDVNANIIKRFVIYMAILTFIMFTVWGFVKSFMNRPPGDYETEVCDIRLKDKKYDEALKAASTALETNVKEDDKTGIGTLAAAYANRGIIKDRNKNYEGALQDYIKALGIDHVAVAGPGLGTIILNYKFKSSSVKERALYLNEQLQLPENERVLSIKELDEGQVMHKPGKL